MTPEGYNELNPLLRKHLQASDTPLTHFDLFQIEEVAQAAGSPNKVSNYLGVMFRRGLVTRVAADSLDDDGLPAGKKPRWAYLWKEKPQPSWIKEAGVDVKSFRPKSILDRPNLHVSEDGTHVTLEMPEITIQIQIRKK